MDHAGASSATPAINDLRKQFLRALLEIFAHVAYIQRCRVAASPWIASSPPLTYPARRPAAGHPLPAENVRHPSRRILRDPVAPRDRVSLFLSPLYLGLFVF